MKVVGTLTALLTLGLILGLSQTATAVQISTATGSGADIELREQSNDSNGSRAYINTRWNALDRNDVVGLRFDLIGYDFSTLQNASLNFVNYRDNSTRTVDIYAVTPGETGGTGSLNTDSWTDGNVGTWGDFPGLLVTDSDLSTLSIDTNKLTLLVDDFVATSLAKGTVDSATSPALVDYLKNLPGTTITLLITQGGNTSGGQFRFGAKEADALEGGTPAGSPGDFAPFLDIDALPIVFTTNKVSTAVGNGADVEMNEATGNASSNDPDLATRWNETSANEVVGLRFDLSGYDLSKAQGASLNLVNFRTDSQARFVDIYVVNPGAVAASGTNDTETWNEDNVNVWNDFPGLLMTDSNLTTISIDTTQLTLLVDEFQTSADPAEGAVESASSAALTEYLRNLTNSTVTLLLTQGDGNPSGGQYRFASKDADALTSLVGAPGQFAPYLEILAPLPTLNIDGLALAAGPSVVVTWDAKSGRTYGVERTTDSLTVSNWTSVASNLVGDTVNTYTDSTPVEAHAAYRVINEGEIPPTELLFEDFEDDPTGDWMVVAGGGHQAGTDWEWGTPTAYSGSAGAPPSGAQEGTGAYGTNLGSDYAPNADIGLRSPVIDLTGVAAATLSFGHYYDMEEFAFSDSGSVFIRDQNGGPITGLEDAIASYNNFISDWRTDSYPLPAAALNRSITIEFRFVSDGGTEFPGWYIDNVRVSD